MTNEERFFRFVLETVLWTLAGLIACGLITLLMGCTTVRYIPEKHYRDSVRVVTRHDTLLLRDSVCVYRYTVGETVYQDRYKARYMYKYVGKIDTVRLTARDTTTAAKGDVGNLERREQRQGGLAKTVIVMAALFALAAWWIRKYTDSTG